MSITVVVAVEQRAEGDKPRSEEIVLQETALTAKNAELARTLAFGNDVSAYVGCGWGPCYFVPGVDEPGSTRRKWSAADTRRLFGKSDT